MRFQHIITTLVCALATIAVGATLYAQTTGGNSAAAERVAAIKQNLAKSEQLVSFC